MSLSRKKVKEILSTAGVDGEHMDAAIDAIIDGHTATVDSLKEERDTFRKAAGDYKDVKKQLDSATRELDDLKAGGNDFEKKYTDLKAEYDAYKTSQTEKETTAKKQEAFKSLLKDAGVDPKRIGSVLRVSDLSKVELNKDGSVKDSAKLTESIKNDWSDFIVSNGAQGAGVPNPPIGKGGGGMTKDDIMKIKDTGERQAAIAENHELFGF